jgi:Domain of unknown function DUF11
MVRRTIAIVIGLIVLILLVLGIRGCLNSRQESAMQDYVSDANALVRESNAQSRSLFRVLQGPGGQDQAVNTESTLNGLRVASSGLVDRADDLDDPDELSTAQRYLLETLELRRDGLAGVANAMPQALADQERRQSTNRISQMMRVFSASDVIYNVRYVPNLRSALEDEDVSAEDPVASTFLPSTDWLDPAFVADQVAGIRSGDGGDQAAAPGLHGNGIGTVTLGGVALVPGGSATVQLTNDLAFEVQVANQGENTETDVTVRATVGEGGDAIDRDAQLDTIAAGETKTVSIPLDEEPTTGENVPVTVEIEPVPGEEMTDNNSADFSVIFTR